MFRPMQWGLTGGEEWKNEGERRDEHLRQRVDDGDLLENRLRIIEGCQERDVLALMVRVKGLGFRV